MFDSGSRVLLGPFAIPYLLDLSPYRAKDDDGNLLPRTPFDAKRAVKQFKFHVRSNKNLLNAKLILLPYYKGQHHTLYVMNKYTGTFDILDTWRYSARSTTRGGFHADRVEIMKRIDLLLREVYGDAKETPSSGRQLLRNATMLSVLNIVS